MSDRPSLSCPGCDAPLIPARGRFYDDGDGHVECLDGECDGACEWMWFDNAEPVTCACGSVAGVKCDDGVAYAVEVSQ